MNEKKGYSVSKMNDDEFAQLRYSYDDVFYAEGECLRAIVDEATVSAIPQIMSEIFLILNRVLGMPSLHEGMKHQEAKLLAEGADVEGMKKVWREKILRLGHTGDHLPDISKDGVS